MEEIKQRDQHINLTIGLDSTFVRPAYQIVLKIIKQIIKYMIRFTTLKSIIPKLLENFNVLTKSKHYHNINLKKYQINENSLNPHEHK